MPLVCSICTSPDRKKIDNAIIAGSPLRSIAEQFGPSDTAVHRHKHGCLAPALRLAEMKRQKQALSLVDRLDYIWSVTAEGLENATEAVRTVDLEDGKVVAVGRDLSALAPLLTAAHKNIEIRGQLTGELGQNHQPTSQINLLFQLPRSSEAPQMVSQVVDAAPVAELAAGDEPDEQ